MDNQSIVNKNAWEYRSYEFWNIYYGNVEKCAEEIKNDPTSKLGKHIKDLGNIKGKKILNALGAQGISAVSLAALGADVTLLDISSENIRYAKELAKCVGVKLEFIVEDILDFSDANYMSSFDIILLERGVLHNFSNLCKFFKQIAYLAKINGVVILYDTHPCNKFIEFKDGSSTINGDYFDTGIKECLVEYAKNFSIEEQKYFPKCLLREWTFSEILNGLIINGFYLIGINEEPHRLNPKLPGKYSLMALKLENVYIRKEYIKRWLKTDF